MNKPDGITLMGNPVLRRKARHVPLALLCSRSFQSFISRLVRMMRHAGGVGLAANQAAKPLAVMVMEADHPDRYPSAPRIPLQIYVNPRLVSHSRELVFDWEGCLSIPGYRGLVPRWKSLTFEARTAEGKKVRRKVNGFEARIVQHEVDHLNGFFYVDRMRDLRSWMHGDEFSRRFRTRT